MNKVLLYTFFCLSAVKSHALLSPAQLASFQEDFNKQGGYMVQHGSIVTVMLPIEQLYQGNTTYMVEDAGKVTGLLEELISQSDGKVYLQGTLDQGSKDIVFETSALYAQVSNLSEFLLTAIPDISYSPVTVNAYYRNDNYGIWKIFPEARTFINIELVID